jgi:RNA polymerase sigma-70 factor (ECF subfamily)
VGSPNGEPQEPTEADLLGRARTGDGTALEQLLERYQPQIFRFAMGMCRDREDAEDILQDSMLAAARSLEQFRGDASLSTWLYAITRRLCVKRRRRDASADAHGQPLSLAAPVADPGRAPDDSLADRELLGLVQAAVGQLDAGSREVLLLRDVEGLTAPEAARVLEMSVPQLKSRLHRARASVRERLRAFGNLPRPPAAPGCPDIVTIFSRYLEDEISQDLCQQMQDHVAGCSACRSICDDLKRSLAACRSAPQPEVPSDVQQAVRDALRRELSAG